MENQAVEQMGLAPDALAGQVAVVTGGGQGIGREVAFALARLGARVVVAEISPAGQKTERVIQGSGGEALFFRTDVSRETDVARLARCTMDMFGPADILINNACVWSVSSVLSLETAAWDRVVAVNMRGTFLTCKALLPQMLTRGRGTIVNVVSAETTPFLSAYVASQSGIAGFSQSLAAEVGPEGVRVVAFAPGVVDTPGLRETAHDLAPHLDMRPGELLRQAMPASRIAAAMVYLVVALADEYHGRQVDAQTVLARAGVATGPALRAETGTPAIRAVAATDRDEAIQQAVMLSERLEAVLAETQAELGRLPDFMRLLAQDGFEGKAGQCIEVWSRTAAELTDRLQRVATADSTAAVAFSADYPRLRPLFEGLVRYYNEALAEPACFTTDTDSVVRGKDTMHERESVVRSLLQALDAVSQVHLD